MRAKKPVAPAACPGQGDLTDLVDTEHINGTLPADQNAPDPAREAYYDWLRRTWGTAPNPWSES